jgi:hypothetical protein
MERAASAAVAIVTADDPAFPEQLKNTPDPLLFLYIYRYAVHCFCFTFTSWRIAWTNAS